MKLGCCLNMVASGPGGVGEEHFDALCSAGYDYAELPLSEITALSEAEFQVIKQKLDTLPISCEVCNNFFPKNMRLTGPASDSDEKIIAYVEKAVKRASLLGVEVIVFGSGGAKNVPEGFPLQKGYEQVVALLKKIAPMLGGITIAIEPLRKAECNLINLFSEGCRLAKDVDNKNVKVLVDFYHFTEENEPIANLVKDGAKFLYHVHLACPNGRSYPKDSREADYGSFFEALKSVGYKGRISVEAYATDFSSESATSCILLRNQMI